MKGTYSERVAAAHERTDDLFAEIGELYALVLRISRHVHSDDEPMTASQRLALIEVAAAGPMRLRRLADLMDTTPATATRAVDALEEWGFVERRPAPADRRGVLVAATARGKRWADRRRALVRKSLDEIPNDALPARLVQDMAKLNAALRAQTGHGPVSSVSILAP